LLCSGGADVVAACTAAGIPSQGLARLAQSGLDGPGPSGPLEIASSRTDAQPAPARLGGGVVAAGPLDLLFRGSVLSLEAWSSRRHKSRPGAVPGAARAR
jgi:hypothetical protein